MSIEIKKSAYQFADKSRKKLWGITNRRTYGAGVALFDDSTKELLLIKQSYGDTSMWSLPGGGLNPSSQRIERKKGLYDAPFDTYAYREKAVDELGEELGVNAHELGKFGLLTSSYNEAGPGRDLFVVYGGIVVAQDVKIYPKKAEVSDHRFFPLDAMPDNLHHPVQPTVDILRAVTS